MYPRGGACTVSVTYPTYGFAAEKDIPKVVSDSEINPKKRTKSNWLLQPLRQNKRHVVGENPVKINKINSQTANFQVRCYPILNETTFFYRLTPIKSESFKSSVIKR